MFLRQNLVVCKIHRSFLGYVLTRFTTYSMFFISFIRIQVIAQTVIQAQTVTQAQTVIQAQIVMVAAKRIIAVPHLFCGMLSRISKAQVHFHKFVVDIS